MVNLDYMIDPGWPYLRLTDDVQLKKKVNKDDTQEINPANFEKTEDMANLTFLNEASVLHNLRQRYYSMMIYTYSGLFLVFVNPYKMLPIYTDSVANMYVNKRRAEMPPHLFAVSDLAYRNMMSEKENQSMLITGESGAGKTENTKKVISYFARIGGSPKEEKAKKSKGSLEDQVVQANPAIEAFGNGATNRNYNSSRYGKFIRIHFSEKGKLVGGDIEHYLLEKSRVIKQAPGERSFHIFYQIMSNEKLRKQFFLDDDIRKYNFVSQAEITVPGMDDTEEYGITDNAFDIMHFEPNEKNDLYKICAAIMHMGNMTFKQKPREEQAEADDLTAATTASKLFEVDMEQFIGALLKPKIKVGMEWVSKGQNIQQVEWAVGALAKAIYARMFGWLIARCNKTLASNPQDSAHWIGVLDIAGFEIFDNNSFEQLWINFVNEKLQQYFNHHMFVLEQEEYKREGIQWEFIDFGLDLQSCIDLIEKPLGIVSMLDEECIVPKASDSSYVDKLHTQHLGKHPNFQKPRPPKGKQGPAHFAIVHYAGTVRYSADSWLDKNKDPLNDSVVAVLKTSDKKNVIYLIWEDYKTEVDREADASRGKTTEKKKGKSGSFMTVSMMYRESLNSLMSMLHQTHPHFIRCIIPNEQKKSGVIEAPLVLNQLTCNGVLEGIRICRKGFPNRMVFKEFKYRYAILAADEASEPDAEAASKKMLEKLSATNKLQLENFKVGSTKVFFKAGILARLEEMRDHALSGIITKFQSACRGYLGRCDAKRRKGQISAVLKVQDNVRRWIVLRTWAWFKLYQRVKPLLVGLRSNAEVEALEKKIKDMEESQKTENENRQKLEEELRKKAEDFENLKNSLVHEKQERDKKQKDIEALNEKLREEALRYEDLKIQNAAKQRKMEEELKAQQDKAAAEKYELEAAITKRLSEVDEIKQQLSLQKDQNSALLQQKKVIEGEKQDLADMVENMKLKVERIEEQRKRAAEALADAEERIAAEKRAKEEAVKSRRKLEGEYKQLMDQFELLTQSAKNTDNDYKRREAEIAEWRNKAHEDANLITKLQINLRQLIARIEQLEEELETALRSKNRTERLRLEAQNELDALQAIVAETTGQLDAQMHLNKSRQQEVTDLHRELEKKSMSHETHIADLCSMQWLTLNNLRNLSQQAAFLENEANRVLDFRNATKNPSSVLSRSYSTKEFYKSDLDDL
uniref:Myosin motor domain-containing protein n=1 Tax=Panagrellus redivivus TaxID=6233 RepID=A0A7E4VF43_PANRE